MIANDRLREGNRMSTSRKSAQNARYFYAIYQPYGCWTGSSRDALMRFDTAAERDELVHRINDAHYDKPEGVCRPMTARDASYAFDLSKFDDDPYGDTCTELNGVRTRANHSVFEIRQRQSRLVSHSLDTLYQSAIPMMARQEISHQIRR